MNLEHQKSNLGPLREPLRLEWPLDGLPTLDMTLAGVVGAVATDTSSRSLLRLIHEFTCRREFVSTATSSRTHAGKLLRTEPTFPQRLSDTQLFDLLRSTERRGWLERQAFKGADRKPRERWQVTAAGADFASILDFAATAATAATPAVPAMPAPGAASPAEPAATAATSPPGGVGGRARTQVTAADGDVTPEVNVAE